MNDKTQKQFLSEKEMRREILDGFDEFLDENDMIELYWQYVDAGAAIKPVFNKDGEVTGYEIETEE